MKFATPLPKTSRGYLRRRVRTTQSRLMASIASEEAASFIAEDARNYMDAVKSLRLALLSSAAVPERSSSRAGAVRPETPPTDQSHLNRQAIVRELVEMPTQSSQQFGALHSIL
jgi:hypothetical protein